jgi:hypothetical protein
MVINLVIVAETARKRLVALIADGICVSVVVLTSIYLFRCIKLVQVRLFLLINTSLLVGNKLLTYIVEDLSIWILIQLQLLRKRLQLC